ncbi:host specificity factor TipJ family phage tail protein [Entomohabitans teleogrylli]|uniref:host specificity factor TipJ family phage tail protein n=1 Tax=Entomohabitans teleogrylli TaxID=1384589 RepID=UPI00073D3C7A|nr:host specificity factor TipJ family phage tail protein [Entomohabitans teleogrylli]
MTIRIYPSRLPGHPLETHEHGDVTFHQWMLANVDEYTIDREHPISVEVDGHIVPASEWDLCQLHEHSDVRIYPVPYGAAVWVAIAVAAASVAYAIYATQGIDTGSNTTSTGRSLDLNPAKANTAKLGDPIRELFGKSRIYPDYILQPITRFDADDPTKMTVEMFVCLGVGNFSFSGGDIRVGDTPGSSISGFSYTTYPPGTDVSADRRSENWFRSTEVGGTSSGSGLDMAQTAPESDDIIADSMTVSGNSVSFIGLGDDDGADSELPDSWVDGAIVTLMAPVNFSVSASSGYSVLASKVLMEIAPYVGMPVTLSFAGVDYDLFIASWVPGQDAVPGEGGSPAIVQGNAAPVTYDFSTENEVFTVTWQGVIYTVSLVANYVNMSGLLVAISDGLAGSGLVAQDNGGLIRITEESSPWLGGDITSSTLPETVFGSSPVHTPGSQSTGGSPAVVANATLAYGSATGTAFSGVPEGVQRMSLAHRGNEYQIISVDGTTATVNRLVDGAIDVSWPGFINRTMIDYSATGINENDTWLGPFLACPSGEKIDAFEVNFSFPNGLCWFTKSGSKGPRTVYWEIQYRAYGSGGSWISRKGSYRLLNINGLGFTERITLPEPSFVEVRCRRTNEQGENNCRDSMYWQALRGRLLTRPTSYAGVTTMGISMDTGGKLAAQSDKRVNIVATRVYDTGTARTISAALYHVGNSLGLAMDIEAIDAMEQNHWTPQGEYFDYATTDSVSVLEMLQKIATAGKSYFLLSDGLATVAREGVKQWTGIISPQEMTEDLQTAFVAPSDDDYDGVDVTYINGTTWAEETVQCRTPGNPTPLKIEDYTLDGVLDQDHAYQIGMRRLMKYREQRLTFTTTTELDALCYNVGDRIIFTDDIPGSMTISCLVTGISTEGGVTVFTVSEPLDWTYENPRALVRYQDGSASGLLVATRVGDYQFSVPYLDEFSDIIMNDPVIEPPRLIFCDSSRVGYDAIISEIAPQSDGTCQVTAKEYRESFYDYDRSTYPGDVA